MSARRHRRICRSWTPLDLVLLALTLIIIMGGLIVSRLHGQTPPMPPGSVLKPVVISWDAPPAADLWNAVDTNGVPVPLTYRVWNATNVTGPWAVVAVTTNLTTTVSNLVARTQFFYVTSSNFFLESEPSRMISIPLDPVPTPRLTIE